MRLRVLNSYNQGLLLLLPLFLLFCCRNKEESPVIPPPTNPLTREFIGYGVVSSPFAHVMNEHRQDGTALAYLRRGSLVKIIERRNIRNRGISEIWVLVDAQYFAVPEGIIQGWLRENTLSVFDNELKAQTAAETMAP